MLKFRLGLIIALVLGLGAGCGTRSQYSGRLHGKVTYKGQPVKAGNIVFRSDTGTGNGTLDEDGNYDVVDLAKGTYTITLDTEFMNPNKKTAAYPGMGGRKVPMMERGK